MTEADKLRAQSATSTDPRYHEEMAMAEIAHDSEPVSKLIGIHDGGRYEGWLDCSQDVSLLVARLARERAANNPETTASAGYCLALEDILKGLQALMAEKRKAG